MAGRIANQLQLADVRGNAAPAPSGTSQKALSGSMFQDTGNAKEQLHCLELLEKKPRIRGADPDALGPDAAVLKEICGTRSPEGAVLARLSKIDERDRDPRLLQLRSVYGSNLRFEQNAARSGACNQADCQEARRGRIIQWSADARRGFRARVAPRLSALSSSFSLSPARGWPQLVAGYPLPE